MKRIFSLFLAVALALSVWPQSYAEEMLEVQTSETTAEVTDESASGTPDETLEEPAAGTPDETPDEPASGMSDETPDEPAAGMPDETPDEPAAGMPDETPDEPAAGTPDETPDEPAAGMPDETTEESVDEPAAEVTEESIVEPTEEATEEPAAEPEATPDPDIFRTGLAYVSENTQIFADEACEKVYGTLSGKATVYVLQCVGESGEGFHLSGDHVLKVALNVQGTPAEGYVKYARVNYMTDEQLQSYQACNHANAVDYKGVELEEALITLMEDPTEAPVEDATEAPVEDPTEAPIEDPTEAPVEDATEAPVEDATEAPVEDPTEAPLVEAPTEAPVAEAPTEEPTEEPAAEPAIEPADELMDESENPDAGIALMSITDNQSEQNYDWNWSAPIESYLVENGDGYMAVGLTEDGTQLLAKYYDSAYNRTSYQYIDTELSLFGGFYAGTDAYYVVYGQDNLEEDDSKEVIRVVKYDKNWKRLNAASLHGANTTIPFDAGTLRMEEYGGYLYIRTSHEMYMSSDGKNHQANLTMQVRVSDMALVDSQTSVSNSNHGYVSHSFNQFVMTDDQGFVIGLDHGDAYPRAILLGRYGQKAGIEDPSIFGRYDSVEVFQLYGESGANYTGATLGGLEYSSSNYLVAGSSVKQDGSDSETYNIFVTSTSRTNFSESGTTLHWITQYPEGGEISASTPQLVKMRSDSFLLLWETEEGKISYVFLNGAGQTAGSIYTQDGYLSDCKPTVKDGKAVWYVTDGVVTNFYTLNADGTLTVKMNDYAGINVTGGDFSENNELHWTVDMDGTLTISGTGPMESGNAYNGPWVDLKSRMKKVIIEHGVTSIDEGGLQYCNNLTDVMIPDTVALIGNFAFYGCVNLETIHVDSENSDYTSQNGILFSKDMRSLLYYPEGKKDAYYVVPNTVHHLQYFAFARAGVQRVLIPANVRSMSNDVFEDCANLDSVIIENKNCFLFNEYPDTLGIPGQTVIYCYENSTADKFAKANGYAVEYIQNNTPRNVRLAQAAGGLQVSWDAVDDAERYWVAYKTENGEWTKAGDTDSTSYIWTGAKDGETYQIRVYCATADGMKTTSTYDNTPNITYDASAVTATPKPTRTPTEAPTITPKPADTPKPTDAMEEPTQPTAPTATPEPTSTPTPGTSGQAPETVWDASIGKLVTPDNPTYTGFANFEGGKFYIKDGQQCIDYVGPVQIDGTFYAFDRGRLQTENMMMAFEGGLFAFNGGTLRTDLIGLAAYDGEQFVFDHGQYQHDACGPYLDPISGKWVYVNYGQFYPITDLVSYDGEVFYFVDGFLANDYTGIVYDFNGTGFYIASGQHYKITDLVSCNGEILYIVDGRFATWYTGVVEDFKGTKLNVVKGKVVQ